MPLNCKIQETPQGINCHFSAAWFVGPGLRHVADQTPRVLRCSAAGQQFNSPLQEQRIVALPGGLLDLAQGLLSFHGTAPQVGATALRSWALR